MEAIKTENLTKYYGKSRGVLELNLSVEQGEVFGFIGPNGAGKSTTIRTLLGLVSPTKGSAQIFGMDTVKNKEAVLQKVGYLPSEAIFYPGMKVKDILKLSADLRKRIVQPKANPSVSVCSWIETERWTNYPLAIERKSPSSVLCSIVRNF